MKVAPIALALCILAVPATAAATTTAADQAFTYQYLLALDDARCPAAYTTALDVAKAQNAIDPAAAHAATRVFLSCAQLEQHDGALQRFNHDVLLAGASELLAAANETGAAAQRSRDNAIALLTPLGNRFFPSFDVAYRSDPADGSNALGVTVSNVTTFSHGPSDLRTIANLLVSQAAEHSLSDEAAGSRQGR